MKTMNAREAEINFGRLLDTAIHEPVSVTQNGREVAVVLSSKDFERLSALEDAWWVALAERNEEEGYLSAEESEAFHRAMLDAQD
jgi:prevent-host-death family protein